MTPMFWIGIFFSFFFGTAIGSFLNVVIWRLPRGESITGRSHCAHCRVQLRALQLIPLVSYLALGRRCASCGRAISSRYFAIELIMGLLFVLVWLAVQPVAAAGYILLIRDLVAVSLLITVFAIDLEHFLILDKIVFSGWVAVTVFNFIIDRFNGAPLLSVHSLAAGGLWAGLLLGGFFFALWCGSKLWYGRTGLWMGLGDAKFALLLGAIAGWPLILVNALLAFVIGAVFSVGWLLSGTKQLKTAVPFGTFLAAAAFVTMLYGGQLWTWYLHLLGWQ